MVGVSVRPSRRSNELIRAGMGFVINLPSRDLLRETDYCGFALTADADKFSTVGFTAAPAGKVNAPLIRECPLNLECAVRQILPLGSHDLFLAEIVAVHVDEKVLQKDEIDMDKLSLFSYSPLIHEYRAVGEKLGTYGFSARGGS